MTVHTTKICHHPYLKLPSQQKPVSITCNPAVTDRVYQDYLQEQEGKVLVQCVYSRIHLRLKFLWIYWVTPHLWSNIPYVPSQDQNFFHMFELIWIACNLLDFIWLKKFIHCTFPHFHIIVHKMFPCSDINLENLKYFAKYKFFTSIFWKKRPKKVNSM